MAAALRNATQTPPFPHLLAEEGDSPTIPFPKYVDMLETYIANGWMSPPRPTTTTATTAAMPLPAPSITSTPLMPDPNASLITLARDTGLGMGQGLGCSAKIEDDPRFNPVQWHYPPPMAPLPIPMPIPGLPPNLVQWHYPPPLPACQAPNAPPAAPWAYTSSPGMRSEGAPVTPGGPAFASSHQQQEQADKALIDELAAFEQPPHLRPLLPGSQSALESEALNRAAAQQAASSASRGWSTPVVLSPTPQRVSYTPILGTPIPSTPEETTPKRATPKGATPKGTTPKVATPASKPAVRGRGRPKSSKVKGPRPPQLGDLQPAQPNSKSAISTRSKSAKASGAKGDKARESTPERQIVVKPLTEPQPPLHTLGARLRQSARLAGLGAEQQDPVSPEPIPQKRRSGHAESPAKKK